MCNLELKTNEKTFLITMSGLITEAESLDYIVELEKNIKNINPDQYNIIVDSRKLNTAQYLFDMVAIIMEMITSTPFKHIKVLC